MNVLRFHLREKREWNREEDRLIFLLVLAREGVQGQCCEVEGFFLIGADILGRVMGGKSNS
jgi:hypothetical protein